MAEQRRITSEAEAIAQAHRLTGFDALVGITSSAQRMTITEDLTPFLWQQHLGKQAWRVLCENVSLQLQSALPGFQDHYHRKFVVLLDENTGQLLSVASKFEGDAPDMLPQPSGATAEAQLQAEQERYHGLPDEAPQVRFLDALDRVLSHGIGSPFLAKEIHGVYVMHSRMGSAPRPVWAITLRGLLPMAARGPYGDTIPVWQRNHMRNVLDARSGEVLFATNSPQPE